MWRFRRRAFRSCEYQFQVTGDEFQRFALLAQQDIGEDRQCLAALHHAATDCRAPRTWAWGALKTCMTKSGDCCGNAKTVCMRPWCCSFVALWKQRAWLSDAAPQQFLGRHVTMMAKCPENECMTRYSITFPGGRAVLQPASGFTITAIWQKRCGLFIRRHIERWSSRHAHPDCRGRSYSGRRFDAQLAGYGRCGRPCQQRQQ